MSDESSDNATIPWEIFRFFLGRWGGTGSGNPGESQVEREYRPVLNEQFIQITDRAVYLPQERNPEGEVHEEIGYISYDRDRGKFVLREFHVEGYVNQYVLEDRGPDGKVLVFRTEAIENIPTGWQARTTYEILGEDEFKETFDLAGPDKEWSCFITNVFKRVD
jgi:hypothetical protein